MVFNANDVKYRFNVAHFSLDIMNLPGILIAPLDAVTSCIAVKTAL